jgi:hypothetical protein
MSSTRGTSTGCALGSQRRASGVYVDVMVFGLHLTPTPDNVEGHSFHEGNNVNGIGITSIVDYDAEGDPMTERTPVAADRRRDGDASGNGPGALGQPSPPASKRPPNPVSTGRGAIPTSCGGESSHLSIEPAEAVVGWF